MCHLARCRVEPAHPAATLLTAPSLSSSRSSSHTHQEKVPAAPATRLRLLQSIIPHLPPGWSPSAQWPGCRSPPKLWRIKFCTCKLLSCTHQGGAHLPSYQAGCRPSTCNRKQPFDLARTRKGSPSRLTPPTTKEFHSGSNLLRRLYMTRDR